MFRKKLDKNYGMVFVFSEDGKHTFWMKNTLIPLDMIWIGGDNKVVYVAQNVQPCKSLICPSVIPSGKAKYVLEINAGISDRLGIKMGDIAEIEI